MQTVSPADISEAGWREAPEQNPFHRRDLDHHGGLPDDEAIVKMVDSNIQREELLPSEKAFAYQMKMEAMKRQGYRSDLVTGQNISESAAGSGNEASTQNGWKLDKNEQNCCHYSLTLKNSDATICLNRFHQNKIW